MPSADATAKVNALTQQKVRLENELTIMVAEENARLKNSKLRLSQQKRQIEEKWLTAKRERDLHKLEVAQLSNKIKQLKLQQKRVDSDMKLKRVLLARATAQAQAQVQAQAQATTTAH